MIRVTTCLSVFVLFVLYIHQNHASTKVLYEFHIREANQQRDEKGQIKDSSEESDKEPELIITGKRTSSFVFPAKDNNYVYVETATYVADNNGYHVKYNITLDTVELDRRLSGQVLKTTAG